MTPRILPFSGISFEGKFDTRLILFDSLTDSCSIEIAVLPADALARRIDDYTIHTTDHAGTQDRNTETNTDSAQSHKRDSDGEDTSDRLYPC